MVPLADRMRPQKIDEYIGQEHVLGKGKLLRHALDQKKLFSMIFWGPPGVGKTTLARLLAKETESELLEFSAVTTGIAEIKKIIGEYSAQGRLFAPIVFIDEIHRFNKAQQDAFLPMVESGKIILIGATTENPSFEIIRPLLSRARVVVLKPLSFEELQRMVERALGDEMHGLGQFKVRLDDEAMEFLIQSGNGDGRQILNTLEIAVEFGQGLEVITKEMIVEAMQKNPIGYDKGGEEHYNTISAFIKSMRASNPDAALYYLARMVEAGEDALFIARRMVIFASEDIGMAQPTALVVANEVFKACETIGYPECAINLAHGVVYLASAAKDRRAYDGLQKALSDVRETGNLPIPMKLRNAPTKLMKDEGYGKGYQMYGDGDLLPEELRGKRYFEE